MEQSRPVLCAGLGIVPIDFQRTAGAFDNLDHRFQRRFAQKGKALFRHFADLGQIIAGKGIAGHEFQQGQQAGIDQRQCRHFFFAAFLGFTVGFFAAAFALAGLWATG